MKYMRQFSIILAVTCAGEFMHSLLPLPVPASIYGLVLMLCLLMSGIVRLESVESAGSFLIEVMPLMFITAGVGLITAWSSLREVLVPVAVITVLTTVLVMAVTGKTTDKLIQKKETGESVERKEAGRK